MTLWRLTRSLNNHPPLPWSRTDAGVDVQRPTPSVEGRQCRDSRPQRLRMDHDTRAHVDSNTQKGNRIDGHSPCLRDPRLDANPSTVRDVKPYPCSGQKGHHAVQRKARENQNAPSCEKSATRSKEGVRPNVARPRAASQDGDAAPKE